MLQEHLVSVLENQSHFPNNNIVPTFINKFKPVVMKQMPIFNAEGTIWGPLEVVHIFITSSGVVFNKLEST